MVVVDSTKALVAHGVHQLPAIHFPAASPCEFFIPGSNHLSAIFVLHMAIIDIEILTLSSQSLLAFIIKSKILFYCH